jgi:hypothetical protein
MEEKKHNSNQRSSNRVFLSFCLFKDLITIKTLHDVSLSLQDRHKLGKTASSVRCFRPTYLELCHEIPELFSQGTAISRKSIYFSFLNCFYQVC